MKLTEMKEVTALQNKLIGIRRRIKSVETGIVLIQGKPTSNQCNLMIYECEISEPIRKAICSLLIADLREKESKIIGQLNDYGVTVDE
jgi:hypothetical protein